jgi:hypothetical protein
MPRPDPLLAALLALTLMPAAASAAPAVHLRPLSVTRASVTVPAACSRIAQRPAAASEGAACRMERDGGSAVIVGLLVLDTPPGAASGVPQVLARAVQASQDDTTGPKLDRFGHRTLPAAALPSGAQACALVAKRQSPRDSEGAHATAERRELYCAAASDGGVSLAIISYALTYFPQRGQSVPKSFGADARAVFATLSFTP